MSLLPSKPTSVQQTIPAYAYTQYNDDDNITSIFAAFNAYVQAYIGWFNNINLPNYTTGAVVGALLNWVGAGLYGYPRPSLPSTGSPRRGPIDTFTINTLPINGATPARTSVYYATTDDVYKRCLTWHFFKGDGRQFTNRWLKRRVARFLFGPNGKNYTGDTHLISIAPTAPRAWTITIPPSPSATVFKEAVAAGILELPFEIAWTVTIT